MDKYVKLIDICEANDCFNEKHDCDTCIFNKIPAADVQPVKRGRWIDIYEYCKMTGCEPSGVGAYHWCSECMKAEEKTGDFCPNCGADMRQDGDINDTLRGDDLYA